MTGHRKRARRDARNTDLVRNLFDAANSPVGRAVGAAAYNAGKRYVSNAFRSYSPLTPGTVTSTVSDMETSKSMFRPSGDSMQLLKRKMSTRLNKDRSVAMAELYNALYPKRSVQVESSFQMYTGAAQKMTCMNVFRHQDLGVLNPAAATYKVQECVAGTKWPTLTPLPNPPADPIQLDPGPDPSQINVVPFSRTVSGYVMRGYGLNVQNPNNVQGIAPLQIQGQMYIGPGNHCAAVNSQNPSNTPNSGVDTGSDIYGVRDNVDPSKYLGVFSNWLNDVPVVHYPNLDAPTVSVGDLMGCCQTLWSPICAQSIEAASANLGFNTLGIGTVASRTGTLQSNLVDSTAVGLPQNLITADDFGPEATDRQGIPKNVPRDVLDPVGTNFTWTKHTSDYKVTNTYSYPVEVEFIVYKVGGLTSRDQVSTNGTRQVTEYYPGLNGPLPYTDVNGGVFDVFFGGTQPLAGSGGTVNRSMILDFMSAWQQKIRPTVGLQVGIQLPDPTTPTVTATGAQPSAAKFQISTRSHWPLTNARWKSFMSPRNGKSPFEFMREFSRKTIRLQSGEQIAHRIDLGGFKYSLQDVGYYSQKGSGSATFKAFPVYSQFQDRQTQNIQYANRGMMNGSVVVCLVLKGCMVAANAPIPRTGPNPQYPADKYGGTSISAPQRTVAGSLPAEGQSSNMVPDRGLPVDPSKGILGNFASGTVNAAASLLVECKESVEFQPMMNKRPKLLRNTQTHTNKSLLLTASVPVSETIRTLPEPSTDTFSKANTSNNFSKTSTS